jgi:hypothetical protein
MKKLMLVLFVLGISLQSFAAPKEKDVIGTWKYKVETDEGTLTGTMTVEKKDGKLVGEVNTDDGEVFAFSKIELKDNDVLYMELDTGYELMELNLTLKAKVLEGTVGNDGGSFPITCEKVE